MPRIHLRKFSILTLSLILMLVLVACSSGDDEGSPIEFTGVVTAIDGDMITVGGFSVDISNASVPTAGLNIGEEVRVTGLSEGTTIIAVVVVPVDETIDNTDSEPETTESAQPETTDEAPSATESPDDSAEATEAPDSTDDTPPIVVDGDPLIVIEGPIESISIDTITIFGIGIEVDPADPILMEIRIGDTIRIQGISSFNGTTIIIVAVNITIVETTIIVINNPIYIVPGIPANCHVKKSGKITCRGSHRHTHRGTRRS